MSACILFVACAFIFLQQHGANGIYVEVSPRDPIVREGQNFTFLCRVSKPLMYCRIEIPGSISGLNMHEKGPKSSEYSYAGEGLQFGQCGVTVNRMTKRQNGRFKCTLGFMYEPLESVGTIIVTVARQGTLELGTGPIIGIVVAILVLVLLIIFMVIFARATGRWCFSAGGTGSNGTSHPSSKAQIDPENPQNEFYV